MIDQVRPAELAAWFAQTAADGLPVLLDVREPGNWNRPACLPRASSCGPFPMGQLAERMHELDPPAPPPACATTACAASMWRPTLRSEAMTRWSTSLAALTPGARPRPGHSPLLMRFRHRTAHRPFLFRHFQKDLLHAIAPASPLILTLALGAAFAAPATGPEPGACRGRSGL